MNQRLEAALSRAASGDLILPIWWTDEEGTCACPKARSCPSSGKHPLTASGLDDATSDLATIKAWWGRWPKANVAERTDRVARIDIDEVEVAALLAEAVPLRATTVVVQTPRPRLHIELETSSLVRSRPLHLADGRKLGDLKGQRGYVLMPPSSVGGRSYVRLSPPGVQPLKVDDPIDWLAILLKSFDLHLVSKDGKRRAYENLGHVIREGEGRHNALTSFAGRVWVEGMTPEAFIAALEAINAFQFQTPLPAAEVDEIARWFLDGREQGRLNGQRSEAEHGTSTSVPKPWRPMPLPADHFVIRYIRYAQSRTDAPPQYHELLALMQLSAVVGRNLRIPLAAKPDGMFCNLWLLLLGDSTLFRKTTSEDLAVDLLRVLDAEMLLANDQSPQGFLEEMSFRDGRASVWHRDEFRSFLAQLKHATWMAGGKELLMKLYDGSSYYRRLRSKKHKGQEFPDEAKVDAPYLATIAAGVTVRIIDVLTPDDVIDGFLPRFLVSYPRARPPRKPATTITEAIEAERRSLIQGLRGIRDAFEQRGACTVQFPAEVWRRWNDYAGQIEEVAAVAPSPELFGPIAGRLSDHALKIAALLQVAEGVPARGSNLSIQPSTPDAAIDLCERVRRDAEDLAMEIGSSTSERRLTKFVNLVKQRPGMQRTDVARALKLDKREMDNLEETAIDRGLVTCGTKNTRGRSAKGYWYKEDGDDQAST